jgi:DNA-directed RNA polymerase subunit N (RpoN/RPB10)
MNQVLKKQKIRCSSCGADITADFTMRVMLVDAIETNFYDIIDNFKSEYIKAIKNNSLDALDPMALDGFCVPCPKCNVIIDTSECIK